MPRRLRARDDIDWPRAAGGTLLGVVLAPGLPIAASFLARWTGFVELFGVAIWSMPVLVMAAVWFIGGDIWSRAIIALLAAAPTYFAMMAIAFFFGCPLVPGSCAF